MARVWHLAVELVVGGELFAFSGSFEQSRTLNSNA